jgi:nucleotide-binding universal stress UspA family protein
VTPLVSLRTVLVPTDLLTDTDCALGHAKFLAERFGARITLYHATEVPEHRFAHWAFSHNHEIWMQAEQDARLALERRKEALGPDTETVVERTGSAQRALIAYIRKTQPDLTVMATHARTGVPHLLLGSVTEKVVQHVYRPVLCVRATEHASSLPYRRILVPTDFSLASRLAFPLVAFLARAFDAEVLVAHVAAPVTLVTESGIPDERARIIPSEASVWKFVEQDFAGMGVTAQVHHGVVWDRLVHVARLEKADLIVMATRGHDSISDSILGSNTERVVRHAPCPVLVA